MSGLWEGEEEEEAGVTTAARLQWNLAICMCACDGGMTTPTTPPSHPEAALTLRRAVPTATPAWPS